MECTNSETVTGGRRQLDDTVGTSHTFTPFNYSINPVFYIHGGQNIKCSIE